MWDSDVVREAGRPVILKTGLIGIVLVVLIGGGLFAYKLIQRPSASFPTQWQITTVSIQPGTTETDTFGGQKPLPQNADLHIQLNIAGGNDDVDFHVEDGAHNIIDSYGRITASDDVSIPVPQDGIIILYLDNSFSVVTSKQVTIRSRLEAE